MARNWDLDPEPPQLADFVAGYMGDIWRNSSTAVAAAGWRSENAAGADRSCRTPAPPPPPSAGDMRASASPSSRRLTGTA